MNEFSTKTIKSEISSKERKILLELIGNEQIHMILKHPDSYETDKYKSLEKLKTKIKDWKIKEGEDK